jgi:uncharacterized protein
MSKALLGKVLLGSAVIALLVYVGLCALLYVRQRSLLYFPQYTRADAASTNFGLLRDGVQLRGWVLDGGGRDPILYFGGNAERIEDNRDDFARWFPGRPVYLLAYRGYGASDGAPREDDLVADAVALYDHVQARHSGQPIAVIGRSLGSGVASHVASRRAVAKLVLVTPFDSLANVAQTHYPWLPVRWLMRDRYASAELLHGHAGSILVVRAGRDQVIPASNTDHLLQALPETTTVLDLELADHDSVASYPAYGDAVSAFMR